MVSDHLTFEPKLDEQAATLRAALHAQHQAFLRDGAPGADVRRDRIDRLMAMMFYHSDEFVTAMNNDFGNRPAHVTRTTEIVGGLNDIEYIRSRIGKWMKPIRRMAPAVPFGLSTMVVPQPLGVVGIIGPWNFPLLLLVQPAAAAFAAGNRVMMKVSDLTPRTGEILERLAGEYFSPEELTVVNGGIDVAHAFGSLPFNHLFFTGSPGVGRQIQKAASAHLVPVTLELGGKNPVVIGKDANLKTSAQRVARGRLVNGGQVCLCPDYVFVPREDELAFTHAVLDQWRASFPTFRDNPDVVTLINEANYARVTGLIEEASTKGAEVHQVVPAGEELPTPGSRRVPPTLIRLLTADMEICGEEVFGPVLSVLPYDDIDEVIEYVNRHPSPLAAYWYGGNTDDFKRFLARSQSGGVTRNDFAIHATTTAAFGGVGESGMGKYHGRAGFDTFSHHRVVTASRLPFSFTGALVPPISPWVEKGIAWTIRQQRRRLNRRLGQSRGRRDVR